MAELAGARVLVLDTSGACMAGCMHACMIASHAADHLTCRCCTCSMQDCMHSRPVHQLVTAALMLGACMRPKAVPCPVRTPAGNIHSMWRPGPPRPTHSYFDVLATLPGLCQGSGTMGILGLGAGTVARLVRHYYPAQVRTCHSDKHRSHCIQLCARFSTSHGCALGVAAPHAEL